MRRLLMNVVLTSRRSVGLCFFNLTNPGLNRILRHVKIDMNQSEGNIEKERLVFILFDKG